MNAPFPVTENTKLPALPIHLVHKKNLGAWLKAQTPFNRHWIEANRFDAKPASYCLLPDKDGRLGGVVCGVEEKLDAWSIAHLPTQLPPQTFWLEGKLTPPQATQLTLGWVLANYNFNRYKKNDGKPPILLAPKGCDTAYVQAMSASMCWARDLINTPANDMHPQALAEEAVQLAKKHKAKLSVITGEALLKENYPVIYTVGKASSIAPRLVDMTFARKGAPKVTLVGKGVCFDSGGLDIKSASGMKLMKKDMGGAAAVLALARALVETHVPVQLRVLLPIVENAVSGNAMRPLDIVPTRKGITVEIGNTDAEGRLILCDALYEADQDAPDLLIDCATLTGAARVALGADMPAFFTPDDTLADQVMRHSAREGDPLWRLPLWKPYRKQLDTPSADLSNDPDSSYGGAITAALYLQEFVSKTSAWLHIDMMAWNQNTRPGRPVGGEAMAVRALYALIKERYDR